MTWNNTLQRTPEWFEQRRGKVTGSRVIRVVNGTARGWQSFAAELFAETQPDYTFRDFSSAAMDLGKVSEPYAIANMELELAEEFIPVGFVQHPDYPFLGASSDFLALDRTVNGEVKCTSNWDRHRAIKMDQRMPKEFYPQVQLQMAVHGVDRTFFGSYFVGDREIVQEMKLAIVEVRRDDRYIDMMIDRCQEFEQYRRGIRETKVRPVADLPQLF